MRLKNVIYDPTNVDPLSLFGLNFNSIISINDFCETIKDYEDKIAELREEERISSDEYDVILQEKTDRKKELEDLIEAAENETDVVEGWRTELSTIFSEFPVKVDHQIAIERLNRKIAMFDPSAHALQPGQDYLILGDGCFHELNDRYHLGVRRAGFWTMQTLDWNILKGDIRLKWVKVERTEHEDGTVTLGELPMKKLTPFIMGVTPHQIKLQTSIQLSTMHFEQIEQWFDFFTNHQVGTIFGFDYETSGFPEDEEFECMGWSISTSLHAVYFDYQGCTPSQQTRLNDLLRTFLNKHHFNNGVYNVRFERSVTHRMVAELYRFVDLTITNIIEGRHSQFWSLKYTVQKTLKAESWDDDFDYLQEVMNHYDLDTEEGVRDLRGRLLQDYRIDQVDWMMDRIVKTRNPFASIHYEILGKYCNLDSYYTQELLQYLRSNYTDECINVYNANVSLGARLVMTGAYQDHDMLAHYRRCNYWYLSFAIFNINHYHVVNSLEELPRYNVDEIHPLMIALLEDGVFNLEGWHQYTMKEMIMKYHDSEFEGGIDDNRFIAHYGIEVYEGVMKVIKSHYAEGVYPGMNRARTVWADLENWLREQIDLSIPVEEAQNISSFYYFTSMKRKYDEAKHQFRKLEDVRDFVEWDNTRMGTGEFYEMQQGIHNIHSTYVFSPFYEKWSNKWFETDLFMRMVDETDHMRDFFNGTQDDDGNQIIEKHKTGDPDVDKDIVYQELFRIIQKSLDALEPKLGEDGNSMIDEEGKIVYKEVMTEREKNVVDVFTVINEEKYNYDRASIQNWHALNLKVYYPEIYERTHDLESYYPNQDKYLTWSVVYTCMTMWKKFYKAKQYVDGMLSDTELRVPKPDRYFLNIPKTEGDYLYKMYGYFAPCQVATKRWSAGFHTIPSQLDLKRAFGAPPLHWQVYFDTSAAEVRAIAYKSGDPNMLKIFESGDDFYGTVAAKYFKTTMQDLKDRGLYSDARAQFKVIVLSDFYNQSADSAAGEIGCEVWEAQQLKDWMREEFAVAKAWADSKVEYAFENRGKLDTILGDTIIQYGVNKHQGINMVIQNYTAVSMAWGFENCIIQSDATNFGMIPFMVVHDSFTSYFPIQKIFEIYKFCYQHFSDYLYDQSFVRYEFDLKIGKNYYDMCKLVVVDENTVKLKGNSFTLMQLYEEAKDIHDCELSFDPSEVVVDKVLSLDLYNEARGDALFFAGDNLWDWENLTVKRRM